MGNSQGQQCNQGDFVKGTKPGKVRTNNVATCIEGFILGTSNDRNK